MSEEQEFVQETIGNGNGNNNGIGLARKKKNAKKRASHPKFKTLCGIKDDGVAIAATTETKCQPIWSKL